MRMMVVITDWVSVKIIGLKGEERKSYNKESIHACKKEWLSRLLHGNRSVEMLDELGIENETENENSKIKIKRPDYNVFS